MAIVIVYDTVRPASVPFSVHLWGWLTQERRAAIFAAVRRIVTNGTEVLIAKMKINGHGSAIKPPCRRHREAPPRLTHDCFHLRRRHSKHQESAPLCVADCLVRNPILRSLAKLHQISFTAGKFCLGSFHTTCKRVGLC